MSNASAIGQFCYRRVFTPTEEQIKRGAVRHISLSSQLFLSKEHFIKSIEKWNNQKSGWFYEPASWDELGKDIKK